MDEWALLDEVDITRHLPTAFFETVRSAKWTERRDSVQGLIDALSQNPRLSPKIKYTEIIAELKLIIVKDSNVVVVALALRALTAFVKGLRQHFTKYIPMVLGQILEKFKEKKVAVKDAIVECLSFIAKYCDSTVLVSPLCEVLEKCTNPNVKANVDQWIYCILCHYPRNATPIAFIKSLAPYLVKHSNDGDPEVREGSYMAFGAILRLTDEKATTAIADGVLCDKVKSKKITEFSEKAEKDYETYEEERIKAGISSAQEPCGSDDNKENDVALNECVMQPSAEVDPWELLTEAKICGIIPKDMQTMLASKQWKERKEMLEKLYELLEKNPRLSPDEDHSELIGTLRKMLEKDVNINVAALAAKCLISFANGLRYRFAIYIPKIFVSAFEKFKERKAVLREPLIELCDALALLAPLPIYVEAVVDALQKPNPQIKTQTALFVSRLLRQHNAQTLPLNCIKEKLGPTLAKLASDADPECRDASFSAVGAIMRIVGENGVNICCGEIMQDENKSAKVRENCENLVKEFGSNASAPIWRLYNVTMKSTETKAEAGNDRTHDKKLKGKMVTKRVSQSAVVARPRTQNTVQQQQSMPAVRSQSARSTVSTSNASTAMPKSNQPIRILESKMHYPSGRETKDRHSSSSEKRSSSDRDEFVDASEELRKTSPSDSSDPDSSAGKNKTFIVERKKSVAESTAVEAKAPSQPIVRQETKRPQSACSTDSSSASICGSRLPSRIPRSSSRSRIPIPIYRRT